MVENYNITITNTDDCTQHNCPNTTLVISAFTMKTLDAVSVLFSLPAQF